MVIKAKFYTLELLNWKKCMEKRILKVINWVQIRFKWMVLHRITCKWFLLQFFYIEKILSNVLVNEIESGSYMIYNMMQWYFKCMKIVQRNILMTEVYFFNTVHVHKEYQISMVFIWLKCLDTMQYELKVLVTALYNI